jgi:2-polyprenyl-3-methyl-5-hydroxy-6-metoxy-1,4-benzoquinol methylase
MRTTNQIGVAEATKPRTSRDFRCMRCERSTLRGAEGQSLLCPRCGATFPIVRGVPRFVAGSNYADSFGYQWNAHCRTQLDSYTGRSVSADRLFAETGWPRDMKGLTILEAGSGAGRFSEVLAQTGASVVSFDYSTAVDANHVNNRRFDNLTLFQGDIYNLPLEPAQFDKVICFGVIQHTPDPESAFNSLARQVRPGGELVIDAYARKFGSWLQWKYLLRPITRRMRQETLYNVVSAVVPPLIPLTRGLRAAGGRLGARLSPILEYSRLGLPDAVNREWAILDTFDMYSPAHDHPQSKATITRWFEQAGFGDIDVKSGSNGFVGKGRLPVI